MQGSLVLTYLEGEIKLTVYRHGQPPTIVVLSETGLANLAHDATNILSILAQERARENVPRI